MQQMPPILREFFGDQFGGQQRQPRSSQGSGSGVIFDQAGYIITNNHVIEDADEIEVTLNDERTYTATLIGTDPSTDIAVIKIDESETLPYLNLANSDDVKVGEWVLAVGNPFNLESTVTAGIVSAKGRNINILQDSYAVESFIQTDAAINPGNSGGALVNMQGQLVGINTAIASPTGAYAGYAFAVPANMVKKVADDLRNYGTVQRAVLGVVIKPLNDELANKIGVKPHTGVYLDSVMGNSAAKEAGLRKGDVIIDVNGRKVKSVTELQEAISRFRPGEQATVAYIRNGSGKTTTVDLKNRQGNYEVVKKSQANILSKLGVQLEDISSSQKKEWNIDYGVRVSRLKGGIVTNNTTMREGFIIQKIDGKKVSSVEEAINLLEDKEGGVMVYGTYPNTDRPAYYGFGL